mmetsp:Transcript_31145/g.80784  ORF Transcript_31145/g.80784 Transcript_31145/m.80784 type:complete len:212 (+) Transcript_31145:455-1090(+)
MPSSRPACSPARRGMILSGRGACRHLPFVTSIEPSILRRPGGASSPQVRQRAVVPPHRILGQEVPPALRERQQLVGVRHTPRLLLPGRLLPHPNRRWCSIRCLNQLFKLHSDICIFWGSSPQVGGQFAESTVAQATEPVLPWAPPANQARDARGAQVGKLLRGKLGQGVAAPGHGAAMRPQATRGRPHGPPQMHIPARPPKWCHEYIVGGR